jgi:hypothetical protein
MDACPICFLKVLVPSPFQIGRATEDGNFSRPFEFIAAVHAPDGDKSVKGAKRRGLPREPLILLSPSGIFLAAMNHGRMKFSRLFRF